MSQSLFFAFVQGDHVIVLKMTFVSMAPFEHGQFFPQEFPCPLSAKVEEALGRSDKKQGLGHEKANMDDSDIFCHTVVSTFVPLSGGIK